MIAFFMLILLTVAVASLAMAPSIFTALARRPRSIPALIILAGVAGTLASNSLRTCDYAIDALIMYWLGRKVYARFYAEPLWRIGLMLAVFMLLSGAVYGYWWQSDHNVVTHLKVGG